MPKNKDDFLKEFDEKFSSEWWNGFGSTDDINRLGINSIKAFLSKAYDQGVETGKKLEEEGCQKALETMNEEYNFWRGHDLEKAKSESYNQAVEDCIAMIPDKHMMDYGKDYVIARDLKPLKAQIKTNLLKE